MTPAQLTANLRSAEAVARTRAGLPSSSALPDNELTYEQRNVYNKSLAAVIIAYPARFTPAVVKTAQVVSGKTYEALTMPDNPVAVFAEEFARQGVLLNESFNPFAETNRGGTASTLKWLLILGAVGAAVVYFGPAVYERGQAFKISTRGKN
jgi:hypothetical protein